MSQTPFQQIENFQIGTVQFVSSEAIIVGLNDNAPLSLTLNNGIPEAFPSVNSFLAIRVDDLIIIGQVEWITSNKFPLPKPRNYIDDDFVDLPYHTRKLKLNPLGIIRKESDDIYVFERGTDILPPLGANVEIPDRKQLKAIAESAGKQRVKIGVSLRTGENDVYIDPDRLFGQHLAILGNTGSGKSCSVAGLIRWSLESANLQHVDKSDKDTTNQLKPNARFIILDPNGEYSSAFDDEKGIVSRVFKVEHNYDKNSLKVPLWLWNSNEWITFTQAATGVQRPLLRKILRRVKSKYNASANPDTGEIAQITEDTPLQFTMEEFFACINVIVEENDKEKKHFDTMIDRIHVMLSNPRLEKIIKSSEQETLEDWLEKYIGADKAENGHISIIDLSLVPTEIVHMIVAVIARIVFEALQRYQKMNASVLPTVLVLDEAHTFIKEYQFSKDSNNVSIACCQEFEKIAREGRKFGLGLLVSSQRPSELSSNVLPQCNSFLLHRITNGQDQDFVQRVVPDNLRALLRELPSLPSQHAILLGWASELPLLLRIRDLDETERPSSENPDFWDVWTGKSVRPIDWKSITDEWQAYAH